MVATSIFIDNCADDSYNQIELITGPFFDKYGQEISHNSEETQFKSLTHICGLSLDTEGRTTLHSYSKLDSSDNLRQLLKSINYLGEINCTDDYGETPLHFAASVGVSESVLLLLDAGANPNVINKGGATPLGLALGNPSMAGTAALSELKKLTTIQVTPKMPGLPCYRHDSKGRTPLHYLVKMEIPSKLEALLQDTSDLICMDNYGETPLHFAAFFGTSEHVSLLLKYGANPNVINKRGETPLGLALGNPSMAGTAALSELKKLTTIEVTDKDPKKIIAKVVAQPKQTCSTSIRLCSTEIVCLLAISKSGNTVFWGTNSYNLIAVAEAKRRGRTCGVKGN